MPGLFEASVGGFLGGVWLASMTGAGVSLALFLFVLAIVSAAFWKEYRARGFIIIAFLLIFFSLGLFRYAMTPELTDSEILSSVGKEVELIGVVSEEPDVRDTGTRLVLQVQIIFEEKISERVLIFTDLYSSYSYGDTIKVHGVLVSPGKVNHDGDIFAYDEYLAKSNIFYVIYRPTVTVLETRGGNFILHALFSIKRSFISHINETIPEPESALAGGLVVGGKQALGEDLLEKFKRTGLIHMVVLSGYNLTIVADMLMNFLSRLPSSLRLGTGALAIILFTLMTGAGPATVRASIMAIIVMLARHRGKTFNASRALLVAAGLMILFSPKILVFDRGFQLSFIATMGLVYISPLISKRLSKLPEAIWKFPFREVVSSTISAQLAVFPWLLYTAGQVSIIAFVANVLVLPLVPVTMFFVAVVGFLGFLSVFLSLPFAWVSYVFLWYDIAVVRLLGNIPLGSIEVQNFSLWAVIVIYAIIVFCIYKLTKRGRTLEGIRPRADTVVSPKS